MKRGHGVACLDSSPHNSKRVCLVSPCIDQELANIVKDKSNINRKKQVTSILKNKHSGSSKVKLITLLQCAADDDVEMVRTLLELDADPNTTTQKGQSVLTIGIAKQNIELVRLILERPEFIVQPSDLSMALIYASFNGHADVVQNILSRRVDISNVKDRTGATPLMMAAYNGHLEVAKLLSSVNINEVNSRGQNVCHIASVRGHANILEHIISKDGDPTVADNMGMTPIHYATQENHARAVEVLLRHGASIDSKNGDGMIPLFLAAQEGSIEVLEVLLNNHQSNIDVDYMNAEGMTALRFAVIANKPEAIRLLLKHGADPEKRDRGSFTCVHTAAFYGHANALKAMIEERPKLNYFAPSRAGNIPLYVAVCRGNLPIVDIMVQQEPELLSETKNQKTWLHFSSSNENVVLEKYFIGKGLKSCNAVGFKHRGCSKCDVSYCEPCRHGEERCHGCSFFLCRHCAADSPLEQIQQWDGVHKYCTDCVRLNKTWKRFSELSIRNNITDCDIHCA